MRSILRASQAGPHIVDQAGAPHVAKALAQLLDPSRDRPARWLQPSFTANVAVERRRLHHVVRTGDLAVPPGLDGAFASVALRLARDPRLVATAVRQLEIERSGALPAWDELVRRGLPATPTLLETVTWF